jgi:hypothetical protein
MTDLDLRLRDELGKLFPEPRRAPAWEDVVARARPPLRRRPLVLALAAAAVVLATAAAVTVALGGFDAWLSGKPGRPASEEEQARFAAANGRSWAAFPKSTQLRELIRTEVGGKTYVLFGFRSGSTLCLKLKAVSLGHSTSPVCTPASTLTHAAAPIVLVNSDSGFDDKHAHPSAEFSFGIVADGVSQVDVDAVDGRHRAVLGGNAYLFVENEPNTGNRVLGVSARGPSGNRTSISLGTTFGDLWSAGGQPRRPRGPARAQVHIPHPAIGWNVRGEKRGFSADRLDLNPTALTRLTDAARFVKPDPYSDIVVGLNGTYCLLLVQGRDFGESCTPGAAFFSRGPIQVLWSGGGGSTSATIAGAAADGIRRVVVFGADGQRVAAPLRENLFALRLANDQLPARVVGYDGHGRVAGVETLSFGLRGPMPAKALRDLRVLRRIRGPNGTTAALRAGRAVHALRCWRVDFSTGQSPSGCIGTIPTGPWISARLVQPAGRDLFVIGHVRDPVIRVRLRFADGEAITTRPVKGLFVLAIPRTHLNPKRQVAFALGLDDRGAVKQRQGVLFKTPR